MFPGFDRIYVLRDPLTNRPFRGEMMGTTIDEDRVLTRGELKLERPVIVRHAMGGPPKDFIWTTSLFPKIVSQRVVDVLHSNRFTGWTTYPVEVYAKDGQRIEGYAGLAIVGRCGPLDKTPSATLFP